MKINFIDEFNRQVLSMEIMRKTGISTRLLGFLIFGVVLFTALPLFAEDKFSGGGNGTAPQTVAGKETGAKAEPEICDQVTKRILEGKTANYDTQASQLARDLQNIDDELKALTQEASTAERTVGSSYDPELVFRAKIGLAQRKKELIERKSAFLQEKIQAQKAAHTKIQYLLMNVFSDYASFLFFTGPLCEMGLRRAAKPA